MRYPLYLIVAALLLSEGLLRVFDPLGGSYLFEIHRYSKTVQSDPRFAYLHPPNLRETFQDVAVSINGEGLRGPEFAPSKPPGTFRVLILGDSVVFGWGVPHPETFPARLSEAWAREGLDVEVIPAGVCSWNTRTEYEFLKAKALAYQPDLLVLVIVGNDTEVKREGRTEVARAGAAGAKPDKSRLRDAWEDLRRFVLRRSHLAANARLVFEKLRAEDGPARATPDGPGWQDARLALDGIVELCRAHGIELVAYLFHPERDLSPAGPLALYQARLRELGVPVFAMPDALFSADGAYRNSVADPHPNARGHALIAAAMERDLRERVAGRGVGRHPGAEHGAR